MIDFLIDLILVLIGALAGASIAGLIIIYFVKRNFFKPKLYFKNVQILPTKGDIEGNYFNWGGLIFTGELHNDSDYWAYNVHIEDIYAEFNPKFKTRIVNKIPLRLATDLPRAENIMYFQKNAQLQNIKPGDKIRTSLRILTKKRISLDDYKQLIKELRMIQIKTSLAYENSSGFKSKTLFWLDFQHSRFVNLFGRRNTEYQIWNKKKQESKGQVRIKSKIIDIETEPF
jgi:hypothetical protein